MCLPTARIQSQLCVFLMVLFPRPLFWVEPLCAKPRLSWDFSRSPDCQCLIPDVFQSASLSFGLSSPLCFFFHVSLCVAFYLSPQWLFPPYLCEWCNILVFCPCVASQPLGYNTCLQSICNLPRLPVHTVILLVFCLSVRLSFLEEWCRLCWPLWVFHYFLFYCWRILCGSV